MIFDGDSSLIWNKVTGPFLFIENPLQLKFTYTRLFIGPQLNKFNSKNLLVKGIGMDGPTPRSQCSSDPS